MHHLWTEQALLLACLLWENLPGVSCGYFTSGSESMWAQVHIITASCENMIDGRGMRPGDILQAANGKTVEVSLSRL